MSAKKKNANKRVIELANTVFWSPIEQDKVYLKDVHIAIGDFPFTLRLVFVRFGDGPALDFSIFDMDRLAIEYLRMRGVKLPKNVRMLTQGEPPPQCDFLVPNSRLPDLNIQAKRSQKATRKKSSARKNDEQGTCSRCRKNRKTSEDWFGTLCPECADGTEGEWMCRVCGRKGDFETMGGCGAVDPMCCGAPCEQSRTDNNGEG
jgi:hypothetical protein